MEIRKLSIHPDSIEAEILAVALEDVELVDPLAPENRAAALDDYWRINAQDIDRSADEARLRALYDAAVADGLELPYDRRGEVQAGHTHRVALALGVAS